MDELTLSTLDFCRCCLLEKTVDIDLIEMRGNSFEYNGEPIDFMDGFETCCGVRYIKIPGIDENAKICNLCTVQLESSYVFQALYTEANKVLVEKYIPSIFSMKSIEPETEVAKSVAGRSSIKRKRVDVLPQANTERRLREKSSTPIIQDDTDSESKPTIITTTNILGRQKITSDMSQGVYKCRECQQSVTNLRKHKMISHPEVAGVFKCTLQNCSKVYSHGSSLLFHLNTKHTS
jgi:hypothetical protein